MSHTVQIQTEIRDAAAVAAACKRLGLGAPVQGTFKMFSDQVIGLGVQLPRWLYPVVCDTASGQVRYDNFGGRWGKQVELDKLLQAYAVERAKIEARKKGHSVAEQQLADGWVKVTVQVSGGAS